MPTAEEKTEVNNLNRLVGLNITSDSMEALVSRNISSLQESFLADAVMNVGIGEEQLRNLAQKPRIPCGRTVSRFACCPSRPTPDL